MNIAEKIGYFNTDALERCILNYDKRFGNADSNPYYVKAKKLIEKQKANKIITDAEYSEIPSNTTCDYKRAAAEGYYLINFHYCFFDEKYEDSTELLYHFAKFLTKISLTDCKDFEVLNWQNDFKNWSEKFLTHKPDMKSLCDSINKLLGMLTYKIFE